MFTLAKGVYVYRAQIIGAGLLTAFISLLLLGLNRFIGFRTSSENLNKWLLAGHHLLLVIIIVSILILLAWNYISSTLRTLFSNSLPRFGVWFMIAVSLVVCAYFGWPEKTISYRIGFLSGLIMYTVVLGILAELFPPSSLSHQDSPYIEDNPKENDNAVLYESQMKVVSDIQYIISRGKPSTIAITGRWGIGKTFLLDRARNELRNDKSIIWVDFEPWRYASEEAIIVGFYKDIGNALSNSIPGIQHVTRPLIETTDKFVRKHDGSGIVGTFIDMLRDVLENSKSPEVQIKSLLKSESKRLIVLIDDVERSFDAERIFRTLQLSLITKNITNVQVIFLFDKEVVLSARPTHFSEISQSASEYLEKFVEREVFIPSPRPTELRQLLGSLMDRQHDDIVFDIDDNDISNEMLNTIATPRGVIRLFNEFAAFRVNSAGGDE